MQVRLVSMFAAALAVAGICPSVVKSTPSARLSPGECFSNSTAVAVTEEPVDPPITFQAVPQTTTRNFGSDRKPVDAVFKLTTESALPKGIEKRLELVADPILRVGETTDSASFPEPKFSTLRVSQNRKTIRFRVCLDPTNDLRAGKYVGTINLEGPTGVDTTAMTIVANAKDGGIFWFSAIVSLLVAFFILLYKGTNDERARLKAEAKAMPNEPKDEKDAKLTAAEKYLPAAVTTFKDPGWLVPTLFAVGGAFGALWAIYDANPSWGEAGPITSGFAVIGAGLAAIGAKTIFTGGR
jgi:hypothetical protein